MPAGCASRSWPCAANVLLSELSCSTASRATVTTRFVKHWPVSCAAADCAMFILEGEAEVLLWVPRPHSDGDSGGTEDGAFAPAAPLCGGRDASPIDAGARSQVRSSRSILLWGKQLLRGDHISVVGCCAFRAFSDSSAFSASIAPSASVLVSLRSVPRPTQPSGCIPRAAASRRRQSPASRPASRM